MKLFARFWRSFGLLFRAMRSFDLMNFGAIRSALYSRVCH